MTHQIPARRPLDKDIFFKTMRGLHPSKKQLEDLEVVEKQTQARDRLGIKDSITVKVVKGPKQNRFR
jgi:hypothetical protein